MSTKKPKKNSQNTTKSDLKKKTINAIKNEITELKKRPSILEKLDSLQKRTQAKIQRKQQCFATFTILLSLALATYLVNFSPNYKYSVNKINNFNFNVFVAIAASLGLITLVLTYFNFNFFGVPKVQAEQNGFEKKQKKKRSQPCQALISLFLSVCVFVPIIFGGLLSSMFSPRESFAIVISDPGAAENLMNISIFEIFPVNSGAVSEKKTSVNKGVVSCEDYLRSDHNGPVLIFANLASESWCSLKEDHIRNNEDVLLLAENWNHRSSSPFPDQVSS